MHFLSTNYNLFCLLTLYPMVLLLGPGPSSTYTQTYLCLSWLSTKYCKVRVRLGGVFRGVLPWTPPPSSSPFSTLSFSRVPRARGISSEFLEETHSDTAVVTPVSSLDYHAQDRVFRSPHRHIVLLPPNLGTYFSSCPGVDWPYMWGRPGKEDGNRDISSWCLEKGSRDVKGGD